MATHSSILAWKIPWTEKPGQLCEVTVGLWLSIHTHTHKSIDDSSVLTALKLGKERKCQERADMKSGLYENSCLTCWWTCFCTCGWSWKFFAYSVVHGSVGPQVANLSVACLLQSSTPFAFLLPLSSPLGVNLDLWFTSVLLLLDLSPPRVQEIRCLEAESSFTLYLYFQICLEFI